MPEVVISLSISLNASHGAVYGHISDMRYQGREIQSGDEMLSERSEGERSTWIQPALSAC